MENYRLYGDARAVLSRSCEERHKNIRLFNAKVPSLNVKEFLLLCIARTNGNQSLFSSHFYVKWAVFLIECSVIV